MIPQGPNFLISHNMNNFEKALKLVEEYRKLRLFPKEKNEFKLKERLLELGYTEEKLELEKKELYLKNTVIDIKEINTDSLLIQLQNGILNKKNTLLLVSPNKSVVYNGDKEFNEEYCKNNNITVFPLGYSGGTIVTTKKDLGIVFILDKEILSFIILKIRDWISSNFKNSEIKEIAINHNDILIDGYKVLGCSEGKKGNMYASFYQVSFDVDIDLIQKISLKKMVKIPKGLSSFGNKTRDDLIKEIKQWLQS
jgi:hypothetical protein